MTTPFITYCTANCTTTGCPNHMDNMPRDAIHKYAWLADGCPWYEPPQATQAVGRQPKEEEPSA